MGKKGDLSDFERGLVVGARRAGLSISKTTDLLGFFHAQPSLGFREWSEKEKISSELQLCGWKCLVDVRKHTFRISTLLHISHNGTFTYREQSSQLSIICHYCKSKYIKINLMLVRSTWGQRFSTLLVVTSAFSSRVLKQDITRLKRISDWSVWITTSVKLGSSVDKEVFPI